MASATLSEEAAGRLRPAKKLVAHRFDATPKNVLGTTTPAGIAEHDPDVKERGARSEERGNPAPAFLGLPTVAMASIANIDFHPDNPRRDYPEDEIRLLAENIERFGLLDPIVVRANPENRKRYQLLSGHRRLLAHKRLKRTTIAAKLVDVSDADAVWILDSANALHKDLNPLEEALLIEKMTTVYGLTEAEVAAAHGHGESWARNKQRLLALPEPWRGRLLSREIDETTARLLLPFVAAPRLLAAFDAEWREATEYRDEPLSGLTREAFGRRIETLVDEHTRPFAMDLKQNWFDGQDNFLGWHPCYVDVAAHRDELDVVKIPVRQDGGAKAKIVVEERITNLDALSRLQAAAIKDRESAKARKEDKADAKRKAKAKAENKELTPAQQKAKRDEAARVLRERIKKWKLAMKRFFAAELLRRGGLEPIAHADLVDQETVVDRLALLWAMHGSQHSYQDAAARAGIKAASPGSHRFDHASLAATLKSLAEPRDALRKAVSEWFWPSFEDPYQVHDFKVKPATVEMAAAELRLDFTDLWESAQQDKPAGAGVLFQKFLDLHNSDQLRTLAKEWDVFIPESATKSKAIAIVQAKATERTLKLPSCLVERGAGRGARGAGKKKANRKGAKARRS